MRNHRRGAGHVTTAWGTLIGLLVGLLASAVDGMIGTRQVSWRDQRSGILAD